MIQVEDIAKAYAGQRLFRELSWRIPDGARIGLVGPNGVGKTTLCRLLAGLEEPDAGRISRPRETTVDRKSTRLNSSHSQISYAVFCLKKKKKKYATLPPDKRHTHTVQPPL